MLRSLFLFVVLGLGAVLTGCGSTAAVRVDEGLVFTPPDWPQPLAGDLVRPRACSPCPLVVLVHGGSWKSGKPAHMRGFAEALAARGYASFSVQYRLVPQWRFPAQLDDVQLALRWLVREADALGIDPDRLGIWGYSAGAHLASLAALVTQAPRLRAVVSGGNPADLVYASGSPLVEALMGGSFEQIPDAYRAASPLHRVSADAPPFFIYHARWDRIVATEHARRLKAALDASGVPNELHWLPLRGHIVGFFFAGAARERAIDFLDRHLRDRSLRGDQAQHLPRDPGAIGAERIAEHGEQHTDGGQ
ncbi:alpha/beta hydrolase [Sinimarinibacterium thermocellulolyticum]|uniref:Alpha/beta hydrolase n=1 Tax=Sinimarinibacterium thermocellulolyticum TaxID=3170016 RepID=A0ABV2ACA3_9GAMM